MCAGWQDGEPLSTLLAKFRPLHLHQLQQGGPDPHAVSLKKESFSVQSPSYQRPKGLGQVGAVQQRGA